MKKVTVLFLMTCLLLSACGSAASSAAVGQEPSSPAAVDAGPSPAAVPETPAAEPPAAETIPQDDPSAEASAEGISFSTTDRNGTDYDESLFSGHTLTVLNFWEPWCGPCVGEMPALQKLSEQYADKGLQVVGVYSTPGMEENVDAVLEQTGVSFLILHYSDAFDSFQTGYVPTTVLVDGDGLPVGEPLIGSRSYEQWEALILEHLG